MQRLEEIRNSVALAVVCIVFHFIFGQPFWLMIASLLLFASLLDNRVALALRKGCLRGTHFLGRLYLNLFLTVLYFFVLTPVAFLSRLFNREKTAHFKKKKEGSYFIDRNITYQKGDFEKTW